MIKPEIGTYLYLLVFWLIGLFGAFDTNRGLNISSIKKVQIPSWFSRTLFIIKVKKVPVEAIIFQLIVYLTAILISIGDSINNFVIEDITAFIFINLYWILGLLMLIQVIIRMLIRIFGKESM